MVHSKESVTGVKHVGRRANEYRGALQIPEEDAAALPGGTGATHITEGRQAPGATWGTDLVEYAPV